MVHSFWYGIKPYWSRKGAYVETVCVCCFWGLSPFKVV